MSTAARGNAEPWRDVSRRLDELRAVLPAGFEFPEPTTDNAPELIVRLVSVVEELQRRGIRDQIQLHSLQEFADSLIRGRGTPEVLGTLGLYLRQVLDLDELLLLRRVIRGERWLGWHAARGAAAVRFLGEVPLEASGIEGRPRQGPDPALPPGDPRRYSTRIPLGRTEKTAENGDPDLPLGLLCFNAQGEATDGQTTELKRAVEGILETIWHREQMERESSFRRQILQSMRDGLVALDESGRLLEVNAAAARMLELESADWQGQPVESLGSASKALNALLRGAVERQADIPPKELTLHGRAEPLPVTVAGSRLQTEGGGFSGLVANLTDLSSVRAMEKEIRRLDRLAALGRFAAGVAHEIRNPLAGIGAGVDYLSQRLATDEGAREDIEFLRSEVRRLNRIVSEMLDYTRPRALELQWLEAGSLVDRISQALAPLLTERRVALRPTGPARMLVWADPDRLEQVLMNLCRNAIEASPPGGEVQVHWDRRSGGDGGPGWARRGADSDRITGGNEAGGESTARSGPVRFRVQDQGSGMSPEEQARAFEPFFTTKGGGTGLGLSLSHAIVEQHGGRLLLESSPGHGTVAVIELPASGQEIRGEYAVVHSDR